MSRRVIERIAVVASLAGVLGLVAAACGDDETASTVPAKSVTVSGAWARTSPMNVENGAAYMVITSPADDRLVGARVDAAVAATTEIHETVMADGTTDTTAMGSDTTAMGGSSTMPGTGEMMMRPVDAIALPAGTAVELKPGGYHVMMLGLAAPLKVGTTIQLTLVFETAGEVVVSVPVRDEAP